MVEGFFLFSSNNNNNNLLVDNSITLLSGPPSSGKTSLLFQFAFNSLHLHNNNNNNNNNSSSSYVTFISSRPKLHSNPPFLSKGIDPSFDEFNRIQIKYVEDEEGINKFFAAFHMHDTFPVLVIIDDFGDFFDERNCQQRYRSPRGRELAIVRTLALCRNAVNHANETGPCMLLFSDTHHGDTPKFLHIYKRWVDSVYTIKGDGIGSFILKNNSGLPGSCGLEMAKTKSAKYSIALQHLVLEETYENEEQLYLV